MSKAFYAGSFDPFTLGHEDIVRQALKVFDEVVIGVGSNTCKNHMFTKEQRIDFISTVFCNGENVRIVGYDSLTFDAAKSEGCDVLIRGLRNASDFNDELELSKINSKIGRIKTVCFFSDTNVEHISSSLVRELLKHNKSITGIVNIDIARKIEEIRK